MLGAIFGDINGAMFEFKGVKIYDFKFFSSNSRITDDSLMTLAVANTLFACKDNLNDLRMIKKWASINMKGIAKAHPSSDWGDRFLDWVNGYGPAPNSCGNGAGMRISPVGWIAESEEQVKILSKAITEVSHNHPEAIKGAEAIAMSVYLARIGKSKAEIREYVANNYYPKVSKLIYDEIWESYTMDNNSNRYVTCQGSIPEAIIAFLDSTSFEDAVRKAIQYGGDSDTLACMAGSIAEAYYDIPKYYDYEDIILEEYIPKDLISIYHAFNSIKKPRARK